MGTMFHIRTALYGLLFLSQIFISVALDCYQCTGLIDRNDCHQVVQCPPGQHCFTNSIRVNDTMLYTMGCKPSTNCTDDQSKTSSALIGREVTDLPPRCSECCSADACNKHLCGDTTQGACADDGQVNCVALQNVICTDNSIALKLCRKTCGLCPTPQTSTTTSTTTPVPGHWLGWGPWNCQVIDGTCFALRSRACSSGNVFDCPGKDYSSELCSTEHCGASTTTTTKARTTTTTMTTATAATATTTSRATPATTPSRATPATTTSRATTTTSATTTASGQHVSPTNTTVTGSSTSTQAPACVDYPSCMDHNFQSIVCGDPELAVTYCPKSCNKCAKDGSSTTPATTLTTTAACSDHVNCSNAGASICSDKNFSLRYCRKTCGYCDEPPMAAIFNSCGDPVKTEDSCVMLDRELSVCQDPSIIIICQNYCSGKCK